MQRNYSKNLVTHKLSNGLTLCIYPMRTIPKVAMQLWYNVGSKDEKTGQKGLAHFLEHMIFKGTNTLSEVDMIQMTSKLSGDCNAFTGYDYTAYIFEFPSNQWQPGFAVLADTMRNCTFKQDMLDSELGAVVQELKLYRDDYESTLEQEMMGTIFATHPYHYPIIGLKQDLFNASRQDMLDFYHTHYLPNNACLVVVGDVDTDAVIKEAQAQFGGIAPDLSYIKPQFHHKKDLMTKEVVLYRDIQQPVGMVSFLVPGLRQKKDYYLDLICWLLADGKGSRLSKKLITELGLVTEIETTIDQAFDYSVLYIKYRTHEDNLEKVRSIILAEIAALTKSGWTDREFIRAVKQTRMEYLSTFEDYEEIAYALGRAFWANGDAAVALTYIDEDLNRTKDEVATILRLALDTFFAYSGFLLPLSDNDKEFWEKLQEEADRKDEQVLESRERTTALEPEKYTLELPEQQPATRALPAYQKYVLENHLTVLYAHNTAIPTVELVVDFKANHWYDPQDKQGLHLFMFRLLLEGTKTYNAQELADEFESHGISVEVDDGSIHVSLLNEDLVHGLTLLEDILFNPSFDNEAVERVREQMQADLVQFWDSPFECVEQYAKEAIYENHPYGKNAMGTLQSLAAITREDIVRCHETAVRPEGTRIAIVGDIQAYDIPVLMKKTFGDWPSGDCGSLYYPALTTPTRRTVRKVMQRDQMVLAFAGLSIERFDKDYDAILIYDQILTGRAGNVMGSKLFALRENSGLFYTITGSLLAHAHKQPGMLLIKTIVSLENLQETQERIEHTVFDTINHLTPEDIMRSKHALISSFVENMADAAELAKTYLFLDYFDLPIQYFEQRGKQISQITEQDIKQAFNKLFSPEHVVVFHVGRTEEE